MTAIDGDSGTYAARLFCDVLTTLPSIVAGQPDRRRSVHDPRAAPFAELLETHAALYSPAAMALFRYHGAGTP